MGHILHGRSLEKKQTLIRKAYDALPDGGALLFYGAIIDDERHQNAFGMLMSLNILNGPPAGFDFLLSNTGADCCAGSQAVGFRGTRMEHRVGRDWMVVGTE